MMVADGQWQEVHVMQFAAITVGQATVERLLVTISELFRTLPRLTGCWGWTFWGSSS
jgi:hypothetical protein